ncbi:MAG: hypothetical protein IPL05_07345 [Betaproteobacteria bacterium]|nr:hypothetical protein [Betaproteobacteria bacterium]
MINLAGEKDTYAGLIGEAMHVFDDQVIVISVPEDGNHILYAFKERYFEPGWRWLHNYAKELRAKFGLDFPAFVQKMERSSKLGLARREAIRRRHHYWPELKSDSTPIWIVIVLDGLYNKYAYFIIAAFLSFKRRRVMPFKSELRTKGITSTSVFVWLALCLFCPHGH